MVKFQNRSRIYAAIIFALLSVGNLNARKRDNVQVLNTHNLSWQRADSLIQSELRRCATAIDSIRNLREFTVSLVKGTWDMANYDSTRLDYEHSLPDLYERYRHDAYGGVCADYADFFSKLLAYYHIESNVISIGSPAMDVNGHVQVAVVFTHKGKEMIQVHDPNHNMEYVDETGEPLDIREQIKMVRQNNYKGKIFTLYGNNPRQILVPTSYWALIKLFYPNRKDVVGRLKSENAKYPTLARLKGSLSLMLENDKEDTRFYLSKYITYSPPQNTEELQLLLPVAIFTVMGNYIKADCFNDIIKKARETSIPPGI